MIFDKHLGLSEHSRTSISNMKDPLDTIHLLLARELLSESADMTIDGERHEVSQHAHQLIPESKNELQLSFPLYVALTTARAVI
jgi:hypothetical protein